MSTDAPTPPPAEADEQARALCQALNAYGVNYVVFGSMAGRLFGVDLPTRDLDIVPEMGVANLQRLADTLNALRPRWRVDETSPGMRIDGRLEPRHFQGEDDLAVGLVTRLGPIDVLLRPRGFEGGYHQLVTHAVTIDVDGVEITVGALDDLIRSKSLLARAKDLSHLPLLEARRAEMVGPETPDPSAGLDMGS